MKSGRFLKLLHYKRRIIAIVLTTLITIFVSSFVIALSGAMMPGPLLTATISETTQRGFIAGPLMIAGHAILEFALVVALLLGLAPFFLIPAVFITIALSGAVILFWMAYGMFRSLPSLSISLDGDYAGSGNHPVINGILLSIANPYWIIWWTTIGTGYILYSSRFGIPGVVFFFTGHILADLAWYSFISAAIAGGRHYMTDRLYRGLIAVCAVLLVIFAGYFTYSGFEKLLAVTL